MKKIVLLVVFLSFLACKEKSKSDKKIEPEIAQTKSDVKFPDALSKVFDAHNGLETWKDKKTLVFDLPKPDGNETHTIDLISRKDKITGNDYALGYDGREVWLLDDGKNKGDPIFYHNLMFYFYAMPFVLADDGINYSSAENLQYNGMSYPGIRISYDNGVGTSSKDEYYLHYNPDSYQMDWLGYTVTYRSGEYSDNVKWIRYQDWMNVDGVILPKAISWYDYEGRTIREKKNTVTFENVSLSREAKPGNFFKKPDNATYVVKD